MRITESKLRSVIRKIIVENLSSQLSLTGDCDTRGKGTLCQGLVDLITNHLTTLGVSNPKIRNNIEQLKSTLASACNEFTHTSGEYSSPSENKINCQYSVTVVSHDEEYGDHQVNYSFNSKNDECLDFEVQCFCDALGACQINIISDASNLRRDLVK